MSKTMITPKPEQINSIQELLEVLDINRKGEFEHNGKRFQLNQALILGYQIIVEQNGPQVNGLGSYNQQYFDTQSIQSERHKEIQQSIFYDYFMNDSQEEIKEESEELKDQEDNTSLSRYQRLETEIQNDINKSEQDQGDDLLILSYYLFYDSSQDPAEYKEILPFNEEIQKFISLEDLETYDHKNDQQSFFTHLEQIDDLGQTQEVKNISLRNSQAGKVNRSSNRSRKLSEHQIRKSLGLFNMQFKINGIFLKIISNISLDLSI